ncbi:hypothetical protein D3C79_548970 [compost metagenome]
MTVRSALLMASTMAYPQPPAWASAKARRTAAAPWLTVAWRTRPTLRGVCCCSTRTRLESAIGVSGWWRMPDSFSNVSPTNRWPLNRVRWFSGKAGQARANGVSSASSKASATGPMLPCAVESKVEQYLKKYCRQPVALSQARAVRDCSTACSAGSVRVFRAMTMASTSASIGPTGTSITCRVRMPPRTSMLARSVPPVKSSAMQPRIGWLMASSSSPAPNAQGSEHRPVWG